MPFPSTREHDPHLSASDPTFDIRLSVTYSLLAQRGWKDLRTFGAKCDLRMVVDAVMGIGSQTFTSALVTAADVGKVCTVVDAGAAAPLFGTITAASNGTATHSVPAFRYHQPATRRLTAKCSSMGLALGRSLGPDVPVRRGFVSGEVVAPTGELTLR